ncbi:MAG: o-succinylbenzoate synthase [Bacteroidales bacterium]|nr:o-succinylbenzoate synthase [Bacteroidales bacterium]MDZ4203262.1 o-succinylbenzoate synthase [Bacteroidales bacterium]
MLKATYHKLILQFHAPAATSRGYLDAKASYIISLYDAENELIKGTGECSLIQGLSPDPESGYEEMLTRVCNNPQYNLSFSDPVLDPFPSIRFGLEMAWHDLKSGGKGVLFESDFTRGKAGIPINGLIWMGTKQSILQQIKACIDEGYRCIKMKIGAMNFEDEMGLLKKVRQEFPAHEMELRLDANGAFHPIEALEKLKRLSDYELHSIEQPIKAGQWEAMARLCENPPVPVTLDEELFAKGADENKEQLLRAIHPQYLVLKPSMLGGFSKSKEWIALANNANIGWWITSALESNIGLNAIAQWTYTLNNPGYHGLGTGKLFSNNLLMRTMIENGFLKMSPHQIPHG